MSHYLPRPAHTKSSTTVHIPNIRVLVFAQARHGDTILLEGPRRGVQLHPPARAVLRTG